MPISTSTENEDRTYPVSLTFEQLNTVLAICKTSKRLLESRDITPDEEEQQREIMEHLESSMEVLADVRSKVVISKNLNIPFERVEQVGDTHLLSTICSVFFSSMTDMDDDEDQEAAE